MLKLKLVICLLGLAYLCSCQTWVGTWTDSEFGGDIFVCLTGTTVNFAFSQTGVGVGTVSSDGVRITGSIYVGGGDTLDHSSKGSFDLSLSNDKNSFSGTYTWSDDNTENDWTGDRVSTDQPSIGSCALLATSGDIEGEWDSQSGSSSVENWDICLSSSDYESSFDNGDFNGYETGVTYKSGLIGSGVYIGDANNSDQGVSLVFLLSDGTLGNFNWQTDTGDDPNPDDYSDAGAHSYIIYRKSTVNPDSSDCSRNSDLDDGNDNDNDNGNNNDSGAGVLTVGLALFVFVLLF